MSLPAPRNSASDSGSGSGPDVSLEASRFLVRLCQMIRGPLVQLLEAEPVESQPPGSPLALALRESRYLVKLLGSLQDHFELLGDGLEFDPRPCAVVELVQSLLDHSRPEAEARGLSLEFRADLPRDAIVDVDAACIAQIITTFLEAAIQTTRQGGVKVSVAREEGETGRLVIAMEDTGEGWPVAWCEQFDHATPDFNCQVLLDRDRHATSLSVARDLAHALGGQLSLETSPDVGTRLELRVPPGKETGDAGARGLARESCPLPDPRLVDLHGPGIAARVLVVSDGSDDRDHIARILGAAGARVVLAESGERALDIVATAGITAPPVDVVLIDLEMPGLNGRETAAELRRRGCDLPIIALTDRALRAERDACLQDGCDGLITRPYDRPKLILMIKASLAARSSRLVTDAGHLH